MATHTAKVASRRSSGRRSTKRGAARKALPAQPALVYVEPEQTSPVRQERVSPALLEYLAGLTGPLTLTCGCLGTYLAGASTLAGQYPVVAVRVVQPCGQGHPDRVSAGVISRFRPTEVEGQA